MSDQTTVIEEKTPPAEPEEKKVDTETPKSNGNEDVLKVLQDIKTSLQKPGEPAPTREEIRTALKEKTGFTDAQLDVVDMMTKSVAQESAKRTAELQEKVTWSEFKDELGGIDPSLEKIMKDELAGYPLENRGDKVLLRKIYLLAKGTQAEEIEKRRKKDPSANDKLNENDNIVGRKIVETGKGSVTGLETNGKPSATPGAQLSDEEKIVAQKMNVSLADYERAKGTKVISQLKGSN